MVEPAGMVATTAFVGGFTTDTLPNAFVTYKSLLSGLKAISCGIEPAGKGMVAVRVFVAG